jgi:hypothetical protein
MRRAISLSRELWLIMRSLQGLRILADYLHDLPTEATIARREIPSAISATLAIVEARLVMLDRVVTGDVNPALAWSPANDAGPPPTEDGEPDIRIAEWSDGEAVRRAREELKRAKVRRDRERARPVPDRAPPTRREGRAPTDST